MINPVNSDKIVNTTTDRTGTSGANARSDALNSQETRVARSTTAAAETTSAPDVETARQLYEMERSRSGSAVSLETPEQARSLLDNLLQQFSQNPAVAASAQLSKVSQPMANLLTLMPV